VNLNGEMVKVNKQNGPDRMSDRSRECLVITKDCSVPTVELWCYLEHKVQ
jgi:hypothetical protein